MQRISLALCLLALGACGGGGGGGSPPTPPPTSFDLAAAVANIATNGLSANVAISGTVNGTAVTGTATVTAAPAVPATFNGIAGLSQRTTVTGTLNVAGQQAPYATSSVGYLTTDHAVLGASDGEYDVAQAPFSYPQSVVVGSAEVLGTLIRYTDSTMSVSLGTIEASYVVSAHPTNSNAVIVGLIHRFFDTGHANVGNSRSNYVVTATGGVSFQSGSAQTTQPDITDLTLTAQ